MVTSDTSEIAAAIASIERAVAAAEADVRPVVSKGALNIRRQLRAEMFASRHFKAAGSAISYDLTSHAGVIEAEIGPESAPGSPGNLANVAYFGTSRGGGTVPDPSGALAAEAPRFERALLDVIEGVLD